MNITRTEVEEGKEYTPLFTYLNTLEEEGNNGSTCFKNLDICAKTSRR